MSEEDWLTAIHKRGGDCDRERDKIWAAIQKTEDAIVAEKIEQIKLSTKIAIYTGLICGIPGFALLAIELYRVAQGR